MLSMKVHAVNWELDVENLGTFGRFRLTIAQISEEDRRKDEKVRRSVVGPAIFSFVDYKL